MAFNTKAIVKDINAKPIPQVFNPDTDSYEVLLGKFGANRVIVYDVNGNAIDLTALITGIVTAINTNGVNSIAKQDTIIGHVDGLETLITAIKDTTGIKKITDALPTGTNNIGKVNVAIDERELRGKAANKPAANAVPIGATYWSVDTDPNANSIEVSNGTSWVVL